MRLANSFHPVLLIIFALQFYADVANADGLRELRCDDCRNINEHPEDARNFALNQIFGAGSWLSFGSTRFMINDAFGNSVVADINAEYLLDPLDYKLINDLMIKELVIQILLYYPNGDSKTFNFYRSLLDPDGMLPVPAILPASTTPATITVEESGEGGSSSIDRDLDHWEERHEFNAGWDDTWGGWVCRADFSNPFETGVVCRQR